MVFLLVASAIPPPGGGRRRCGLDILQAKVPVELQQLGACGKYNVAWACVCEGWEELKTEEDQSRHGYMCYADPDKLPPNLLTQKIELLGFN